MAKLKVHPQAKARLVRLALSPAGKILLVLIVFGLTLSSVTFTYFYVKYSRLIDEKLKAGPFAKTSRIYAAPRTLALGDIVQPSEVLAHLRRSGYTDSRGNRMGWYHLRDDAIEIFPGPDSFQQEAGVIRFMGERISGIVSAQDHTERNRYLLEPELITNLSDRNREKRRLVRYDDIPKVLVNAVVSAEDKRFFSHAGFDPLRVIKAAYVDIKEGYKREGASTLSMQLARLFWLTQEKHWTRKAAEVLITLQLEQRLSKEQIFEYYSNQVNLGWRGSFAIHGFGQASQVYFSKDIRQLALPEAAMLAALVRLPSFYNPYRHPERMKQRRNVVLSLMRQNGYITDRE
ncbi:MAG: transglycosylase domain-containing protein, partial [Bryobacteraceae bacterium]